MNKRFKLAATSAVAVACAATVAHASMLAVSIGVRETGFAGGTSGPIGSNGGTTGGIEFINLDGQSLDLNGTFQTFTFNFPTDPATAFAGTSANSILEGTFGVLEMIRIRNVDGELGPIQLYVDNIRQTSPTGAVTTVSDFEGFANGTEVTFQEPRFSGSTASNLALTPNFAGVTDAVASQGSASYDVQFQFVDATDTRWVRLTTFATGNLPNPLIEIGQGWSLSFDLRGSVIPEPASAAIGLGLVPVLARRRRRRD